MLSRSHATSSSVSSIQPTDHEIQEDIDRLIDYRYSGTLSEACNCCISTYDWSHRPSVKTRSRWKVSQLTVIEGYTSSEFEFAPLSQRPTASCRDRESVEQPKLPMDRAYSILELSFDIILSDNRWFANSFTLHQSTILTHYAQNNWWFSGESSKEAIDRGGYNRVHRGSKRK